MAQGRLRSAAPLKRPLWIFHRLRAMEPGEVQYRLGQAAASAVGRLRPTVRSGSAVPPRLPASLIARWNDAASEGPRRRAAFIEQFPQSLQALREEADALRQGRLRLFGTREITVDGEDAQSVRRQRWLSDPALAGVGDFRRLVWEVNRDQHWPRLALIYVLTGERAYHTELTQQVEQWRIQNPSTRGVNWQSPMEVAIRAQNWMWTMRALTWAGGADDPLLRQLWALLPDHVNFVAGHPTRFSSANNHVLVEAAALAILAAEFPELPGAAELRSRGLDILVEELPRQVYPDGVSTEQAFRYHAFVLEQLLVLLAASGPLPGPIVSVIGRMADFLADLVSDGDLPTVGDSDDGRILRLTAAGMDDRELVGLAGALLARPDLVRAGRWGESAFWITAGRPAPEAAATSPPAWLATSHYPDGGYTIIRSPDHRMRVLVDHGPLGLGRLAAHGHADCLSILMWLDGRPLLIDSGSYLYGAARYRDLFRSTGAHNTVVVGERDQSEMLGPFLWGRKADGQLLGAVFQEGIDLAEATHNGYLPRRHRRMVLRVGDSLLIVSDAVTSPTPCVASASFYFAPTLKPVAADGKISVDDGVTVSPVLPGDASMSIESVPVAAGFARLSTSRVLRYRVPVRGETIFHTVFAFDAAPEIVLRSGWLQVSRASGTVSVAMGPADNGALRFDGGSAVVVQRPDGNVDVVAGRDVKTFMAGSAALGDRIIRMDRTPARP